MLHIHVAQSVYIKVYVRIYLNFCFELCIIIIITFLTVFHVRIIFIHLVSNTAPLVRCSLKVIIFDILTIEVLSQFLKLLYRMCFL